MPRGTESFYMQISHEHIFIDVYKQINKNKSFISSKSSHYDFQRFFIG